MNMRSYVKCPWPGSATLVLRMGARDSRQHRVAFQPTHVCVSLGSKQANRKNLIARAQRNGRDEGQVQDCLVGRSSWHLTWSVITQHLV